MGMDQQGKIYVGHHDLRTISLRCGRVYSNSNLCFMSFITSPARSVPVASRLLPSQSRGKGGMGAYRSKGEFSNFRPRCRPRCPLHRSPVRQAASMRAE